jgi:hypothetical protein
MSLDEQLKRTHIRLVQEPIEQASVACVRGFTGLPDSAEMPQHGGQRTLGHERVPCLADHSLLDYCGKAVLRVHFSWAFCQF